MRHNEPFSLIIIVKDREQHLLNVLRAVNQSTVKPAEIIVVRMNERRTSLDQKIIQVELVDNHALPLAKARNSGARKASCDRLVFLDVDCIPAEDCFKQILEETDENDVTMVDPYYLSKDVKSFDMNVLKQNAVANQAREGLVFGVTQKYELFWSLGFCVNKRTYEVIGGFDEAYIGYGGEDTDFSYRMQEAGVALRFSSARVYHQPHGSVSPPLNWLEDIVSNARVFKKKWGDWPMRGWLDAFQDLGYIDFNKQAITIIKLPTVDEINAAQTLATTE